MARGDASLSAHPSDEAQTKLVELRQVEQCLYLFFFLFFYRVRVLNIARCHSMADASFPQEHTHPELLAAQPLFNNIQGCYPSGA